MRLNKSNWFCGGMVLGMLGFLVGCGETGTPPAGKGGDAKGPKKEEHAHEEGHVHGPNGGEVVELKNGDEEFHVEWDHDDTGLVTFYLLDKDLKNVAETDAAEITIESKVGDKEPTKYTLPRVSSESQTVKTSKFELTDKALMTSLLAPEGVTNTLKISIGGKEFSAPVKHDPAHEHH